MIAAGRRNGPKHRHRPRHSRELVEEGNEIRFDRRRAGREKIAQHALGITLETGEAGQRARFLAGGRQVEGLDQPVRRIPRDRLGEVEHRGVLALAEIVRAE